MTTTSKLTVDEGTQTPLATYDVAEDAETKKLSRTVLNDGDGNEISTLPVSAASLPLPTGAATAANQQTDALTDAELRATPVPVSGTVTATTPITTEDYDTGAGTDTVATVGILLPKSGGAVAGGTATDPIRTDPTGATTQPVSAAALPLPTGAATAANQQTDALTDAELRATPVPVSGTVATGGLTDAQLRASPVPVDVSDTTFASTIADGADVALGAIADAAVDTDTTGTVSGKLRGLVKLMVNLLSRWPAALGAGGGLKVDGSGTPLPVSGTVAATLSEPISVDDNGGSLTVDVGTALPAGTNNLGIVRTIPTSGRMIDSDDGTTVITVKTAAGLATASGDNVVLAAVSGKKIRVLSYGLQVQSTDALVACIWQDTSTATQRGMRWMLTGTADGTSMQGVVRNPGDGAHFYFETAAGVGLDLNLSATADVAYELTYVEVD